MRYRWNEQSSTLYQEALASNCLQEKIKIINSTNYQENTDRLGEDLNSVHCEAADVAMLKKSSKVNNENRNNTSIRKKPAWHDASLISLKRNLEQKQQLFHKFG